MNILPRHLSAPALAAALAASALATLAGCASSPSQAGGDSASTYMDSDDRRAALYRAHAGEPINGFLGGIHSWTALNEHSLVVWTGSQTGYLLEIAGPCSELPWAQAITLSNGRFSRVDLFDEVRVLGRGGVHTIPCPITKIRPLDTKALREAEKAERAAERSARDSG